MAHQEDPETLQAITAHIRSAADHYPTLAAHGHMEATDWDTTFALGLEYLLDGMAARLRP
ncbi:TetR/AcrR family transcriptional regulator C-terminal domain-containing protein [Thermomonospora cellulosilytica]|uniref:Tetracycline repressor TetR C-terminal domain-containing protein n=1 Tax=Thermomonospora cellulosilytica TaxID=1411118 RepID=A0A7W3R7V3_9ACTN|nr:TetR/AcrR family transcriptional regulator C-terminal domain-containing protein [Thermomonospora cellulosilytica]MBA9002924.1 hypothetical protein [Thermomonospora cellulosilytica]